MPSEQAKKHYEQRLAVCQHNALRHNADSAYWRTAAEVYEHLIDCPLIHTVRNGATPSCQWEGLYEKKG